MPRIFVYDGREFDDPDPDRSVEEVRHYRQKRLRGPTALPDPPTATFYGDLRRPTAGPRRRLLRRPTATYGDHGRAGSRVK